MSIDYQDFELEIGEGDGATYPVRVNTPLGPGQATLHFPYNEQELENRLLRLENALLTSSGTLRRSLAADDQQVVESFGVQLFDRLFTGQVGTLYEASKRTTRQAEQGLRVKLRIQSPKLAALPWELLYDKQSGDYICLSRHMPLIRYLDLESIQSLPVKPPLQILGMMASPSDLTSLDVAKEKAHVEQALATLQQNGQVKLTWLEGQSWRALQSALQRGPSHIFHFIGHGRFSADQDQGQVAFSDDAGRAAFFYADELGRMLGDHFSLRLVVLNSCEGARSRADHIFSSTAAALVRRGTPSVLAMQYSISDNAAIQFSETFYSSLAYGLPVDAAVSEARKAIGFNRAGSYEWATPVLTMRVEDGQLFTLDPAPEYTPPVPIPPKPRKNLYFVLSGILIVAILFSIPGVRNSFWASIFEPTATPMLSVSTGTPTPTSTSTSTAVVGTQLPPEVPVVTVASNPTNPLDKAVYVYIPAGEFAMGTTAEQKRKIDGYCELVTGYKECKDTNFALEMTSQNNQQHLPAFWIMQTEVTNAQYESCVKDSDACTPPANDYWNTAEWADKPVTHVNWSQALAYANWAGGRLPTEVEWEMACRSTDDRIYPWSNGNPTIDMANFKPPKSISYAPVKPVASFAPTANNLHDMAGNVWEWTSSLVWTYPYDRDDGRENLQTPGDRIKRGGSIAEPGQNMRCAYRSSNPTEGSSSQTGSLGFRVVLNSMP